MPELPEVESTRRALLPELVGASIVGVKVHRPRMLRRQSNPHDFAGRLIGRRINRLRRHGKFLLAEVGESSEPYVWVTHLGMSGRVQMAAPSDEEALHSNVLIRLNSGREFRLVDPRTFGYVVAWTPEELAESPVGQLGPDALTDLPSAQYLKDFLVGRKAQIKPLLLGQRIVAGLGNIYSDEALHRARISPHRAGVSLNDHEVGEMREGILHALAEGIRWGGTSLGDLAYLLPDGRAGEFMSRLQVYGRAHEECLRCGGLIVRDVLRQRSTHWCPQCQI